MLTMMMMMINNNNISSNTELQQYISLNHSSWRRNTRINGLYCFSIFH